MVNEDKKDIGAPEKGKEQEEKPEEKKEGLLNNPQEEKADVSKEKADVSKEKADAPKVSEQRSVLEGELTERVISINRVAKVVKGGKNFSFSALIVAGDGKGSVGMGFGKSNEVAEAIKKGSAKSKKALFKINLRGDTIPHEVIGKFKASRVMLKPAGPGTGVIAGGPVRALCDAAGIKNILTKSLGSRNDINVIRATINGFGKLRLKRRG
jgi:small subunit ribosomal protein S5